MTKPRRTTESTAGRSSGGRHWLGFLLSGGTAFTVDAAALELLVRLLDLNPLIARLFAILLAMVAGWLAHRTLTFAVTVRPTLAEFLRYAASAWTAASINYATFAALILAFPGLHRLAALVIASFVAAAFAYLGMRYLVFRRHWRS